MLKVAAAVDRIGDALGIGPRANQYLTRRLREDGRGFWPEIGSGRRGGDVSVAHIINNLIAHCCAPGVPGEAVQAVDEFNRLIPFRRDIRTATWDVVEPNKLLDPTSFQETSRAWDDVGLPKVPLAAVVRGLMHRAIRESISGQHEGGWPTIIIMLGTASSQMQAAVTWPSDDSWSRHIDLYGVDSADSFLELEPSVKDRSTRLYQPQVVLSRTELLRWAGLAIDATEFDYLLNAGSAPGQGGQGNLSLKSETAAPVSLAGGTNAAVANDQTAKNTSLGSEHPQSMGEREKSQPPFESQAGHSRSLWSDRHDRHREHRISFVAAA